MQVTYFLFALEKFQCLFELISVSFYLCNLCLCEFLCCNDLGLLVLSPPEAEMPPKSKQITMDPHVNIHELSLDYMCGHHQKLQYPLSQTKW